MQFLMMPLIYYREEYHKTRLQTTMGLICWISAKRLIVNGCAGSDASVGKRVCKNVSVLDYALVSSDLLPLISEFVILAFCELYSDVHCPIVLTLNVIETQDTELEHFESDDDVCLVDAEERNLQFIT